MTTQEDTGALQSVAQALTQIDSTLKAILTLMQEREAAFKERKSFDRKPPFRKPFDRDRGGDFEDRPRPRAPRRDDDEGYAPRRKPSFRDDGDRGSNFGPKKKSFGPPRGGDDRPPARRKSVRFEE